MPLVRSPHEWSSPAVTAEYCPSGAARHGVIDTTVAIWNWGARGGPHCGAFATAVIAIPLDRGPVVVDVVDLADPTVAQNRVGGVRGYR